MKNFENNKKFEKIEKLITEFLEIDDSVNILDNYNHRTLRIKLKIQEVWPDFNLTPGRNKSDVEVPSLGLKNVEVKTMNAKKENIESFFKKKYMFDKQDRKGRRKYILTIDGLVFSIFLNEKLFWIFWTNNKNTLDEYKKIATDKQETFLNYFKNAQSKKGNGGFDTINISISEFSDNSIWNFYYKNKIYLNKKLIEIKEILLIKR